MENTDPLVLAITEDDTMCEVNEEADDLLEQLATANTPTEEEMDKLIKDYPDGIPLNKLAEILTPTL